MKSPQCFDEIAATPQPPPPPASELRDWSRLADLALGDVLRRLIPCLRSISAFAATCGPWRRFFLAFASTILQGIPPVILSSRFWPDKTTRLLGFSPHVMRKPVVSPLPDFRSTLLSSSRGHLILLFRPRGLLVVVDALTGAERLAIRLPSPGYPYHYASLTPTYLLLFVSKHAFVSLAFPTPDPAPEWTHHRLPREASFVAAVVDFRGRGLGVTDRAQLLEFRLDDPDQAVELLPTTGLPDNAAFERWQFGPRLVAAGERLLLLLIMTDPEERGSISRLGRVQKVSVHALDMATMRWEELDDIGEYSLFVDCAGRSAVACADAGGCGVVANRVYFLASCGYDQQTAWKAFQPGSDCTEGGWNSPWPSLISTQRQWPPSQTWVYPRLFYRCEF